MGCRQRRLTKPSPFDRRTVSEKISLQLRVLRLGFLQDGDVGVGVFPEGEEIWPDMRVGGIASFYSHQKPVAAATVVGYSPTI
jgi:hypothetical protein